jgi:hypothetical protein
LFLHSFAFDELSHFPEFGVEILIQTRHLIMQAADFFSRVRCVKSSLPNCGLCNRVER